MKYPIRIGYIFEVLSKGVQEEGCVCLGSISIYFEGEIYFENEPCLGTRVPIVPPLLRNSCSGGALPVIEVIFQPMPRRISHSVVGPTYTRKAFKVERMSEFDIAEAWDVERVKSLAKDRIFNYIVPYMLDVVGLKLVGEVPYYKEW